MNELWVMGGVDRSFGFPGADSGGWTRGLGVVEVPEKARSLVLMLAVGQMDQAADKALLVDDLAVYKWPD